MHLFMENVLKSDYEFAVFGMAEWSHCLTFYPYCVVLKISSAFSVNIPQSTKLYL